MVFKRRRIKNILAMKRAAKIILIITVIGIALRLIGIQYGLPLWLIGDEPPFVLATLKMIELKSIIPALNSGEFSKFFYFSPYLSYIYLPFFIVILAVKYLLLNTSVFLFKNFLLADLSQFFILARILSVAAGAATIYAVYKLAKNIFESEGAAIGAAGFIALSLHHILLSHWGRDWTLATLLFVVALIVITNASIERGKRYMLAALLSGIAFGVSVAAAFIPIFLLLWILFAEKRVFREIIKDKNLYLAALIFIGLAALSVALYPGGFFLARAHSVGAPKTLEGFFETYISFLKPIALSEPILFLWSLIGLVWGFFKKRGWFWSSIIFVHFYILIFYLFFHTGDRFMVYLIPLFAVNAGYGLLMTAHAAQLNKQLISAAAIASFVFMAIAAIRLDQVIAAEDTRLVARAWAEENIPPGEKIMVLSPLTRLARNPESLAEQEAIDPSSLRQIDYAEAGQLPIPLVYPRFHALNLYSIGESAKNFYQNINKYREGHDYRYAIVAESGFAPNQYQTSAAETLKINGAVLARFPGSDTQSFELTEGAIGSLKNLFSVSRNGPTVAIYGYNQL